VQQELADVLAQAMHLLHLDAGLRYTAAFFDTMAREWGGIDRLRIDKFYNLVRCVLQQVMLLIKRSGFSNAVVDEFLVVVSKHMLRWDYEAPISLVLHVAQYWVAEVASVIAEVPDKQQEALGTRLMGPMVELLIKSQSQVVLDRIVEHAFDVLCGPEVPFRFDKKALQERCFEVGSDPSTLQTNRARLYKVSARLRDGYTSDAPLNVQQQIQQHEQPQQQQQQQQKQQEDKAPAAEDVQSEKSKKKKKNKNKKRTLEEEQQERQREQEQQPLEHIAPVEDVVQKPSKKQSPKQQQNEQNQSNQQQQQRVQQLAAAGGVGESGSGLQRALKKLKTLQKVKRQGSFQDASSTDASGGGKGLLAVADEALVVPPRRTQSAEDIRVQAPQSPPTFSKTKKVKKQDSKVRFDLEKNEVHTYKKPQGAQSKRRAMFFGF
jgi:ribosomal RNA-processing protein 1